jgi:tRNA pseudouridine55 synthase
VDRLFVVNKPINRSSNSYLGFIKRKYKVKKAGFSGTLDPFACGCLVVAFGKYTQLFQYLQKVPKTYRTTIWLGATSPSLDNENVESIKKVNRLDEEQIKKEITNLKGTLSYLPPKYSAKKIDGKRAYDLARGGKDVKLKEITSDIYNVKFLNYNHPFISMELTVSEGSYIRSIAQVLLDRLSTVGTLSYLERLHEGKFQFENEIALDPLEYLKLDFIEYKGSKEWMELGRPLRKDFFEEKPNGSYIVKFDTFFSIVKVSDEEIKYELNRIMINE